MEFGLRATLGVDGGAESLLIRGPRETSAVGALGKQSGEAIARAVKVYILDMGRHHGRGHRRRHGSHACGGSSDVLVPAHVTTLGAVDLLPCSMHRGASVHTAVAPLFYLGMLP